MNKKIILSLSVIGVVAAIAVGGTIAYFSDTETSVGNTFTAGTIDISLDSSDGQAVETVSGDLDLKPSQVGWTKAVITNDGTNPAEIWKHIGNVENNENGIVEPEQEYYNEHSNSENWKLSNWIHYDMSIAKPFYDTRNMAIIWGQGLYELEGELVVEVFYGCEKTLFKATAPSDYGNNGMMTFAFDMDRDAEDLADFQIQWEQGMGWRYKAVESLAWGDWQAVPGEYKMSKSGRVYTLELPTEDLGKKYKLGVDSNDQVDGNGQVFFTSSAPDTPWYSPAHNDYIRSDWFVLMKVFKIVIEEEDGFYLTPNQGGNNGVESHWMYLGELEPKAFMCVKQSYHLDKTVDNWGQSDMVSFDVDFMAQQTTPVPEDSPNSDDILEGHGRP